MLQFMDEVGDQAVEVIVKSDQERSIQFLVKDLIDQRKEGKTIPEESPVQSSGSNGVVERGVQEGRRNQGNFFWGSRRGLGGRWMPGKG